MQYNKSKFSFVYIKEILTQYFMSTIVYFACFTGKLQSKLITLTTSDRVLLKFVVFNQAKF